MTSVNLDMLEEIQHAQPAPGPDRKGIAEAEIPNDANFPPVRVQLTDSTGYVQVYHVGDGDVRVIPRSVLVSVLAKRLPDGRRAFTTAIPSQLPNKGLRLCCPLHPKHADATLFAERGFPSCEVDTLRTEMDVQLHLEHKHKAAWRWWEARRLKAEHDAQVETQRLLASAIAQLAQRGNG